MFWLRTFRNGTSSARIRSFVTIPQYCQSNIFEPLEMENTGWLLSEIDINNLAVPYDNGTKRLPHYSFPTYPDGALRTSVLEYAKFLSAIIGEGEYKGKRILKKSTIEEMLKPQSKAEKQGLAWNLSVLEDQLNIYNEYSYPVGHSGRDPGVQTSTFFNTQKKIGVIFFTNGVPGSFGYTGGLQKVVRNLIYKANTF